ncbi:MAG: hemerythrin domain-containing protein [Peptoniphilus sp. oral taxon 375]|nr:hemerythrin domain-containing protein [Peptoniphilus sp. oral taxon 375]
MYAIQRLELEHENILAFTDYAQDMALSIMEGEDLDLDQLKKMVAFIRTYCDQHHHQKEEDYLFKRMEEDLGDLAVKLVQHGMIVEHNLARKYVMELDGAIDDYGQDPSPKNRLEILSYLMAYVHLLRDHAEKENKVVYPFAAKHLSKEAMDWVDQKTKDVEDLEESKKIYRDFEEFIRFKPEESQD